MRHSVCVYALILDRMNTDGAAGSSVQRSAETRKPVRVTRGYKIRSNFAPDEGYRYDGLYVVEQVRGHLGMHSCCVADNPRRHGWIQGRAVSKSANSC